MTPRQSDHPPFMIFALPRSRTRWLSSFLTYADWNCHHEPAITMRKVADICAFFRLPRAGAAETGASLGWRLLEHHVPELRRVVVRRPVEEVVASLMRADIGGVATYDEAKLRTGMLRGERALADLSRQRGVLTVDYRDLRRQDACEEIFEHCLPYRFNPAWWRVWKDQNIQKDVRSVLLYYYANRDGIEAFKAACKAELWRLVRSGSIDRSDGKRVCVV